MTTNHQQQGCLLKEYCKGFKRLVVLLFTNSQGGDLDLVYTDPDKFLHGQLVRFHLAFSQDQQNWTKFLMAKCASLGPAFSRSQTCTLSCSKICPILSVPCKRKVELCKFLLVQKFVWTPVNGAFRNGS